jgi:hypothetical protein
MMITSIFFFWSSMWVLLMIQKHCVLLIFPTGFLRRWNIGRQLADGQMDIGWSRGSVTKYCPVINWQLLPRDTPRGRLCIPCINTWHSAIKKTVLSFVISLSLSTDFATELQQFYRMEWFFVCLWSPCQLPARRSSAVASSILFNLYVPRSNRTNHI